MVADLSFDHRHGVGGEAHALGGVETLDRLDQSQIRYLKEILVGLVGSRKTFEHVVQQPLIVAHHLLETGRRAGGRVLGYQLLVVHRAPGRGVTA